MKKGQLGWDGCDPAASLQALVSTDFALVLSYIGPCRYAWGELLLGWGGCDPAASLQAFVSTDFALVLSNTDACRYAWGVQAY